MIPEWTTYHFCVKFWTLEGVYEAGYLIHYSLLSFLRVNYSFFPLNLIDFHFLGHFRCPNSINLS